MALRRRTDRALPTIHTEDPDASPVLPPPATPASLSRTEPPPDRELVIESKTGKVRQAGADSGGAWLVEQRLRYEQSLYAFTKGVLKRRLLSPHIHKWFCASLTEHTPPYRKMRLIPRGHLKSSIVSEAMPIHMHIQPAATNLYWPGEPGNELNIILAGEKKDLMGSHLRWIEQQWESNQLLRGLWPHRAWDAPRRQAKKWNEDEMILPRETDYADPSLRVIGVDGAITGAHCKVIIKDDLISLAAANSQTVMQSAIDWHIASRALLAPYEENGLEFIIGCLPADSQVTMADGTKQAICDVRKGDCVWSPAADGSFTARRVERVINQGMAETIQITTSTTTLRATPNHPLLVSRNRRDLVWVRADELVVGDLVVAQKAVDDGRATVDADFAWLFGFLFGDGWVNPRPRRGYVCFSPGLNAQQNTQVLQLLRRYVSGNAWTLKKRGGYYRCDTASGAALLSSLGLCAGAKRKRIPAWVYRESKENRLAFLRGFTAADGGFVSHDTYRVEIASAALLEDLRHLARLCGVRVGKLHTRTRETKPPHSNTILRATSHHSSFNFATVDRRETYNKNLTGGMNVGRDTALHSNLRFDRVVEIAPTRLHTEVWDLTVEGNPAFVANGLAVHNTRWAVSDLYSYIAEHDPSVDGITRAIVENGRAIWPEQFPPHVIDQLRRDHGVRFYLFYMNNAENPELVDFSRDQLRWYTIADGEYVCFDEDERDAALAQAHAPRPAEQGTSHRYRGRRLTPDTQREVFSGRTEYLRLKSR